MKKLGFLVLGVLFAVPLFAAEMRYAKPTALPDLNVSRPARTMSMDAQTW